MGRKYVIVGTGAAGLAAAETIRELDPSGEILIFGDDLYGFYSRPGVAYFLTGELTERQLSLKQGNPFCRIGAVVTSVLPESHIIAAGGKEYPYDKLLLATGSLAVPLAIPGSDLKGVVKLDNLADAKNIIKQSGRGKTGVVVGGGIIALEMVEAFLARGMKTWYLIRSNRYWPNVLDKAESEIVENRLKAHGVIIKYETELARVLGEKGKVVAVETKSGEKIKCDVLGVAIGIQPRIELAKAAGLKTEKGILTDEFLRTTAPDVFAAGDCAQVRDPATGKSALNTLWGTALVHGRTVGRNMTGSPVPVNRGAVTNIARLAGITTTIIGSVGQNENDPDLTTISRGDSESWRQIPDVLAVQADFEVNHVRIMVGPRHIEGAIVMGDQTLSRPLRELVAAKADVSAIAAKLRSSDVSLTDTILDFWSGWRYAVA